DDVTVVAERHARERARRLALRAGRDDADLVVAELVDLLRVDERALGELQVAELARGLRVVLHRAPDDRGPPAPYGRDLDDLLDPRDVRGEGRDEDAPLRAREDRVEQLADVPLRRCVARHLG